MNPTSPTIYCANPECKHVLDAQFQPGLRRSAKGYFLITCLNPVCELNGFTFSEITYPPLNLDIYLESGRKRLVQRRAQA